MKRFGEVNRGFKLEAAQGRSNRAPRQLCCFAKRFGRLLKLTFSQFHLPERDAGAHSSLGCGTLIALLDGGSRAFTGTLELVSMERNQHEHSHRVALTCRISTPQLA